MLLLFAMVDKLHAVFKEPRPYHPRSASGDGDEWIPMMRERLQKYDQGVLKELTQLLRDFEVRPLAFRPRPLPWTRPRHAEPSCATVPPQDELLPAGDATEVFDVLGVLSEVLNEAPSADAWLGLA